MKLITFSLWGQNPKYLVGAIRNAELAKQIYPDWICRFYVGQSVPSQIIFQLERFENVQIVQRPEFGDWRGMFWRFLPASEDDVEVMISRDTDSRLSYREKAAVDEWLASKKALHIMRDHPYHRYPILGGMWGVKKGAITDMKEMLNSFDQKDAYGTDYQFLADNIINKLDRKNMMVHDEFFGSIGRCFPEERKGLEFVGKVFDENEQTVAEHEQVLQSYLKHDQKDIYVYHHLGLGDHLDCNAICRALVNEHRYKKVNVFAKTHYSKMIEFMYRDEPRINVIPVDKNNEAVDIRKILSSKLNPRLIKIGHDEYPWGREKELNKGCAEIFYDLAGMEYHRRFDEFYFDRDPIEEERLLKKLNPENKPYVFVHDDPARGYEIPLEKIKDMVGDRIIIKNDISENMFYFCKILENADQIHCMESSFRSLVETLNPQGKLYFHNFRSAASGFLGNSTQQPWQEIKW